MKKVVLIVIVILLQGCSYNPTTIENIDISNYRQLVSGAFGIYALKEFPDIQYTIGISVENLDDEICFLGNTTTNGYIVFYKEEFISLGDGVNLGLFDTYNLMNYGVPFQCHDK